MEAPPPDAITLLNLTGQAPLRNGTFWYAKESDEVLLCLRRLRSSCYDTARDIDVAQYTFERRNEEWVLIDESETTVAFCVMGG